jgi:aryl-alcohol dehydrogenase-like predicted oxidoreductase
MNYRKLGRTNLEVSEIGYGAWGIGGKQWLGASDQGALKALHLAVHRGINFFDTALAYNDGHSERLLAKVLEDAPQPVYIATKVPPMNQIWPAQPGIGIEDVFPYEHIVQSTEKSLVHLRRERLDLQQLHVWNPEWIGRDEWKRAFEDLKKSGKVRFVGVSINDHQPDSALEIINSGLIDTVQVIYNIFDQTPENRLFPLCREKNIGVIARVPFDEGGLTGRITEDTKFAEGDFRDGYFKGDRKQQVASRVEAMCDELGVRTESLPALALRFCLTDPAVSTVIPGMRSISSVDANSTVPGQGPLPPHVVEILRRHAWDRNFYND